MNPKQTRTLVSLILSAGSLLAGGCGNDRQTVHTMPRGKMVQVDTTDGVRVKAPFVNVQVPSKSSLPPSNGIDVPIIEHD